MMMMVMMMMLMMVMMFFSYDDDDCDDDDGRTMTMVTARIGQKLGCLRRAQAEATRALLV